MLPSSMGPCCQCLLGKAWSHCFCSAASRRLVSGPSSLVTTCKLDLLLFGLCLLAMLLPIVCIMMMSISFCSTFSEAKCAIYMKQLTASIGTVQLPVIWNNGECHADHTAIPHPVCTFNHHQLSTELSASVKAWFMQKGEACCLVCRWGHVCCSFQQ